MEINIIPDWVLSKLRIPEQLRVHVALWLSSAIILAGVPIVKYVPHICLFRTLVGIPCPGCGVTTALKYLAGGDLSHAWRANPAGLAVGAVLLLQLVARPLAIVKRETGPTITWISGGLANFAVASLFAVWILRVFLIS